MMRHPVIIVVTISLLAALFGVGVHANDEHFDILSRPKALPEFSLVDQDGKTFTRTQLENQWTLMFIGFTSCPDVCPVTLMKLAAIRDRMKSCVAKAHLPEVILLAVDPERDQENLKGYLDYFGPHNTGITGDWKQIDTLVKGLGGAYRFGKQHAGHDGYEVAHTTAVYVIDTSGVVVARMNLPLEESSATAFLVELMGDGASVSSPERSACLARLAQVSE